MSEVGNFTVHVWQGSYPAWCILGYNGEEFRIHHKDLEDLEYAVKRMKKLARMALPDNYKHEV